MTPSQKINSVPERQEGRLAVLRLISLMLRRSVGDDPRVDAIAERLRLTTL